MMNEIIWIIGLTLLPFLELRASIPYGILNTNIHWILVFIIAVVSNVLLGPLVYIFVDKFMHLFLKIEFIDRIYTKIVEKTQTKIKKYVEKYGELGIALFIAVPLPGSGSYSGALGAYLMGLDLKKFIMANLLGVLIAGFLVTLIVLSGTEAFSIFLKVI